MMMINSGASLSDRPVLNIDEHRPRGDSLAHSRQTSARDRQEVPRLHPHEVATRDQALLPAAEDSAEKLQRRCY